MMFPEPSFANASGFPALSSLTYIIDEPAIVAGSFATIRAVLLCKLIA
jgi:hypothetical protein